MMMVMTKIIIIINAPVMGLRGGGKRKIGGTAGVTKEQRLRMLKESIGTSIIRINAIPGVSPVVTECVTRFNQISQGVL